MGDFDKMIGEGRDVDAIAAWLDGLSPEVRLAEVRGLSRSGQRALFDRYAGRGCTLARDFVPEGTGPLQEVIHEGRNSLWPGFQFFQKRFARSSAEPEVAVGYNEQAMMAFTGPGYFVAREAAHESGVPTVVIDYTRTPRDRVSAWPPVLPNTARFGRFVYDGTQDWMWRVSTHVTIGRARRASGWIDNWFLLCRT